MWELLELVLQLVLEGLCGLLECDECGHYWRFYVPVMVGFAGSAALDLFNSAGSVPWAFSVVLVSAGILTGIIWQVRGG